MNKGFSNTENNELRNILNMKANQSEVDKLFEVKTNKVESERIMSGLGVISR